ncbi:MAG TPA: hypothetical protein VK609_08075, partial [Mucilaginibacter sp.]|nr:hypothetical protein [Mucilaginibacter sp.]
MAYCAIAVMVVLMSCFFNRFRLFGKMLVVIALLLPQFSKAQKTVTPIVLNNEQLPVLPKEFYVATVTDERDDRSAVAWLLPTAEATSITPLYKVDFKYGAQAAIKQFVNYAIPSDKALRPVIVRIKKFKLAESLLAGGRAEGKMEVALSFDLKRAYDNVHLID